MKGKKDKKISRPGGILIHPTPDIRDALIELADLDGRPLKNYIERLLMNYIKGDNPVLNRQNQ